MSDNKTPVCPGCGHKDKVVKIRTGEQPTHPPESLVNWYCDRCHGRLSALPTRPATGANPPPADGQRAKRGRKEKEGAG